MKSATEALFGKNDNCSKRLLSCPLDNRHPETAVRYVQLNPVRASLIREAESYQWGMGDSAECMVTGGAGCGSSVPAVRDRQIQRRWVSWTATLPPHSPGCDNAWALGPAGLVVGRRRSLGQGSLEKPDGLMEAVRRESGTGGKRYRYSLTETAFRARFLWAESGLPARTPLGSRVFVAARRTGTAVGLALFNKHAAVRSDWYETRHQLAAARSCGRGAELPDGGPRVS